VALDPSRGRELRKTRPCVVVSPPELNVDSGPYIVVPLTTGGHAYAFRVPCRFGGKDGYVVLDQVRTVDAERMLKPVGRLMDATLGKVLAGLQEMFAA
jgi:mRNA interferase MazF